MSGTLNESGETEHVIALKGAVSGENLPGIEKDVIERLATIPEGTVTLDLCDVSFIDSRGVSLCIRIFKQCASQHLAFSIKTNPAIFRLLSSVNLTNIMNIQLVG